MNGAIPRRSPGPVEARSPSGKLLERAVHVVTLVHGGGPVSSENDHRQRPRRKHDEATPLRGTAVRGQLRFWWRATHGCTLASIPELRQREDALWGNASAPGIVDLRIQQSALTAQDVSVDSLGGIGTGLRYGAFAASNLTRLRGEAVVGLTVGSEAAGREVADALTAWLLFGGIGGRTRRGFGALSAAGLPDPREFVAGLRGDARVERVPALRGGSSVVLSKGTFASAEDAHKFAVDAMRKFRQGVGVGRNEGQQPNRPGRSRWPEADQIRRMTDTYPAQHAPVHPVEAFPRGAFGMPIVFHFMGAKEPDDAQLVPGNNIGRMASPLILRPVSVGGRWHAMAARLLVPGLPTTEAVVTLAKANRPARTQLRGDEAREIRPLAAHGANPDVLAAFLTYFTSLSS